MSICTFASLISSTIAWFKCGTDIEFSFGKEVPLQAGAEAAYFGGGTGTSNDPYFIYYVAMTGASGMRITVD